MTQSMSRRRVLQGLGMLGLGGVARTAGAQDTVPTPSCPELLPPLPGTVGLLRGQFARLAVVSHDHGDPAGSVIPDLIVAEIIGADGKALASAEFSDLGPNEARFLDFVPPANKGKPGDTRLELFGRVRYPAGPPNQPPGPPNIVGASLQIVDSGSGLTLFSNNPEIFQDPTLGNGQTNDAMPIASAHPGTIGFVRGQALRVSMVQHEYGGSISPDLIVADVLDGQGNVLASQTFSNVKPHQAVFLDFMHPGGKGAQRDTRMEVIVHVRYTPGRRVGATVSVLDTSTGQTAVRFDPEPLGLL